MVVVVVVVPVPCLNVLFTPDDQRMVREFGLTMSVLSFIFCSVALWVFLSMPDVVRRKSVPVTSTTAKSSRPNSRGSMFGDLRLSESIQNFAANVKSGRLFANYSKAQIWVSRRRDSARGAACVVDAAAFSVCRKSCWSRAPGSTRSSA